MKNFKAHTVPTVSFIAIATLTALPAAPATAAPNPQVANRAAVFLDENGVLNVDVPSGLVLYRGSYYTDKQVLNLNRAGKARFGDVRVVDGTLVAAAFDSPAELGNYEESLGTRVVEDSYPVDESPDERAARLIDQGEDPALVAMFTGTTSSSWVSPLAMIPGCPALTYGSRDYDDADCGGAYLASFPTDAISWYGTYGHNDKMTSLDIENNGGGCVIIRSLYNNVNYDTSAGFWRYYGTPYAGTSLNLPSTQNDRVSSSKSQCS